MTNRTDFRLAVLAVALALGGCNPSATEDVEPPPTAAAGSAGPTVQPVAASTPDRAAEEQERATAMAFIERLYAPYTSDSMDSPLISPDAFFEPELARRLNELLDAMESGGDMHDAFSADPVCGCQDFGAFTYEVRDLQIDAEGGKAIVAISNFGEGSTATLHLARTAKGWRIADIDGTFREIAFGD